MIASRLVKPVPTSHLTEFKISGKQKLVHRQNNKNGTEERGR